MPRRFLCHVKPVRYSLHFDIAQHSWKAAARRLGAAPQLCFRPPFITPEFSVEHRSRGRSTPTSSSAYTAITAKSSIDITDRMLTDKQPKTTFSSPSSGGPAGHWNGDSNDVSTLFPANFLEPTTPETFLELDPAGFFTHNSSHSSASKGTCVPTGFGRTSSSQPAMNRWLEPSREPCTDEIPWSDLVFWLGNASTGEVVCSCVQCTRRVMRGYNANLLRQQRYSPYQQQQLQQQQRRRVSSRVPVINMPRIEGVN